MSRSAADLTFRPAVAGDAARLAPVLRQADRDEIVASSGPEIQRAIEISIARSLDCWTVEQRGELVAVLGLAPISMLGGIASPWLLGTPLLDRLPGALTRAARGYLAQMLETYPHLVNYVDARNTRSVRWLRRVGFTIHPAAPHGVAGLPFHRFELKA